MKQTVTLALTLALSLGSAIPATAQQMSAADFEAYTQGKTLFYGSNGRAYGAETYMSNRRVMWSFLDGECKEGYWYEENAQICFVYEDRLQPQCWTFEKTANGLIAEFQNEPGGSVLYEAQNIGEEMICKGPKVGV